MPVIFQKRTTVKQLAEYLDFMCTKRDDKPVVLASDVTLLIKDGYDPVLVLDIIKQSP